MHALKALGHRSCHDRALRETLAGKSLVFDGDAVVFALEAIQDPVSLFEPVMGEGGDAVCVMDQVKDEKESDAAWLEGIALKEAMNRLTDRERKILRIRFYEGRTQMEVAGEIGISQAQVSRLEKSAIRSIRKAILPS